MAENERQSKDILVQVCIECGTEYIVEPGEAVREEPCEKCGNAVYRPFHAVAGHDEVDQDYRAETERDTAAADGPTDVTSGDLHDLERL